MGLYIFWPAAIVIPQMILSELMKAFKVPQRKRKVIIINVSWNSTKK